MIHLDEVGNTTAIGMGFAISAAALAVSPY